MNGSFWPVLYDQTRYASSLIPALHTSSYVSLDAAIPENAPAERALAKEEVRDFGVEGTLSDWLDGLLRARLAFGVSVWLICVCQPPHTRSDLQI